MPGGYGTGRRKPILGVFRFWLGFSAAFRGGFSPRP